MRRAVIIACALGVPQTFYERYASWLVQHGCVVYTFDWRGMAQVSAAKPGRLQGQAGGLGASRCACRDGTGGTAPPWFAHHLVRPAWAASLFGMMPQHPRIDRVATLGSGSGYREHVARPLRYVMGVFWHVIVPLSVARHGYFAGRRIRTVDDLPRGVVAQWKRWCSHPDFVVSEGEAVRQAYASVKLPITAVVFTDDTMASPRGVKAMHSHYTGTQVDLKVLRPEQHGLRAVGHFHLPSQDRLKGWSMSLPWLGLACARSGSAQCAGDADLAIPWIDQHARVEDALRVHRGLGCVCSIWR